MHPDTLCLIALHKADVAHEGLLASLAGFKDAVHQAKKKLKEANQVEAEERMALAALEEREKNHNLRYERYLKKSKDTELLLQSGQLSNYAAGEEQLKKCRAIADEEETSVLLLFEAIEEQLAQIEAKETIVALRKEQLQSKEKSLAEKGPTLNAQLTDATEHRANQANSVRDDHLLRYEQIKKKLRHAVVTISQSACDSCGLGISSMPLAEHSRGSAVHTCSNCGRFLGEVLQNERSK
jgi:predicted  nucleic acid-binding Zn-ribbon protein